MLRSQVTIFIIFNLLEVSGRPRTDLEWNLSNSSFFKFFNFLSSSKCTKSTWSFFLAIIWTSSYDRHFLWHMILIWSLAWAEGTDEYKRKLPHKTQKLTILKKMRFLGRAQDLAKYAQVSKIALRDRAPTHASAWKIW